MDLWSFDERRTFVAGLWFRVVSAAAFLILFAGSYYLGLVIGVRSAGIACGALAMLLAVNGIYWGIARLLGSFSGTQFYFHWTMDVVIITATLYGLGDIAETVAIPSFSLIIVTSAAFISKRAAGCVAAMSAVAIVVWTGAAVDVDSVSGDLVQWPSEKRVAVSLGSVLFFGLIAFLAGTLADSLREIGDIVASRNRELASSNRELERLQEELGFQARMLVHDIRSPVSAAAAAIECVVSGGPKVDLARDGPAGLSSQDAELMEMALENLQRVDVMIDRLREAEEARAARMERVAVSVASVIEDLGVEFDVALEEREAKVIVAGGDVVVEGDRDYLGVVFRNLIGNALRYVPCDGTGVVQISSSVVGAFAEIRVSDNGSGIDPKHGEDLFEMFRKGPGDDKARGMGLGLALARRVVERHGGAICFSDAELGGATVLVRLPVREDV